MRSCDAKPSVKNLVTICCLGMCWLLNCPVGAPADEITSDQATAALRKAVRFFQESVSSQGGYLWRYSADLKIREGEGQASPTTAWLQPPGTPSVGQALLDAYVLTGNESLLAAAKQTAYALVNGQLESGGWDNRIEFDPKDRRNYAYRSNTGTRGRRNTTTFDDDKSQSAFRFLMHMDQELGFQDERIHEAVEYGLAAVLKAQYPNGAWPQRYSEFPDPDKYPVVKANYPETWSRTFPNQKYQEFYTFNDNAMGDVIDVLLEAAKIYNNPRYQEAAEKGGDFMLLAQMPDPQPAWAQQYNLEMQPAWARKFEPASITGGESQGVMRTLLQLYRQTGKQKYLDAVLPALKYLKASRLPDGRLARFYELKANTPLYFTKDYKLTYSSDDMPTHYGFIVGSRLADIEQEYQRLKESGPDPTKANWSPRPGRLSSGLANRAKEIIASMDSRGAWVEPGTLRYHGIDTNIIDCRTFISNVETLSEFIAASNRQ